jgi:hypothetical protein
MAHCKNLVRLIANGRLSGNPVSDRGFLMHVLDSVSSSFSQSYAQARQKFLAACERHQVAVRSYDNPNVGPGGEALAADVAWFGPQDAQAVFVMLSATHGVEGFCGSACQIDWLDDNGPAQLADGTAVLLVHAINPHGFAWQRRVTEEGCDLNRNYVDFDKPLPENPGHDELLHCFVPERLEPQLLAHTEAEIQAFVKQHGEENFQIARKAGQYKHAHSVFFGGFEPTWSRRTLEQIVEDYRLSECAMTSVLDYHTGLGPFGYGEPICGHAPGSVGIGRVGEIYGESVGVPEMGTSSSIPLHGTSRDMWDRYLGDRYTYVALEYGTYSPTEGLRALRADHWLHWKGEVDWQSEQTQDIKAKLRHQFFPEFDDWKEMVIWRSRQVQRQTFAGLAKFAFPQ